MRCYTHTSPFSMVVVVNTPIPAFFNVLLSFLITIGSWWRCNNRRIWGTNSLNNAVFIGYCRWSISQTTSMPVYSMHLFVFYNVQCTEDQMYIKQLETWIMIVVVKMRKKLAKRRKSNDVILILLSSVTTSKHSTQNQTIKLHIANLWMYVYQQSATIHYCVTLPVWFRIFQK